MIDLYTAAAPNARRATLLLEELGLPYRIHNVDIAKKEHKSQSFLALNPLGCVPVIIDTEGPGGQPITISQSAAIAIYLAEKSGRLLARDGAARVETLRLLMHIMSDVAAASTAMFFGNMSGEPSKLADIFKDRLTSYLALLDAGLEGEDWLAGELSIADFALYPIMLLPHVKQMLDEGDYPRLKRWVAAVSSRPSVARALAASPSHH